MALCAAKLLLHLFTSVRHYGYFRDELYYLDLARHLDWGYVDCAPLIAVYAKVALLMGGSLAALRILPALAGAGTDRAHHPHRPRAGRQSLRTVPRRTLYPVMPFDTGH